MNRNGFTLIEVLIVTLSTLEYSVTTYITIRPEKGFDFDAGNIATPTDTAAATGGSSR
jgi:hypothetical protein